MAADIKSLTLALALLTAGAACSSSLPDPEFERLDVAITPGSDQYPDADAVVLLDRGELLLTVDGRTGTPIARLRRLRRIKILRADGLRLARVEAGYESGAVIHGLIARAISPDGAIVDADSGQIADSATALGGRAKALKVPGVAVGSIVEATWDTYTDDLRFLPPWVFASDLPTQRSEFAVVVPPEFEVDLRFSEGGRFVDRPANRFDTPQGTRFSWSLSNLPRLFAEVARPSPQLTSPRAHVLYRASKISGRRFTGFRSWDEVARWLRLRRPNFRDVSEATREEAKRVAGSASEDERALKLMEVLARDLEAVPGVPPPLWQANLPTPDSVLRSKRANPSSRGLLLVALLGAAGIEAFPAMVAYSDRDTVSPDAPIARSLDAIVAYVPRSKGPLVLDPNQLTVSAEVFNPRLMDQRIVVARDDRAEIVLVPKSRPDASKTEIRYDLKADVRGDIFGQMQATLTGAEAGALRTLLAATPPEDYARVAGTFLAARGAPMTLDSVSIADRTALRRPLTLKAQINIRAAIDGEGTELNIAIKKLVGTRAEAPTEVRRAPLLLGAPAIAEVRGTLTLPEEWEHTFLPDPVMAEWPGSKVRIEFRKETRRRLGFVRTETRQAMQVTPEQWRGYRRFCEAQSIAEDSPFGVKRPPPRKLEY